MGGLSGILPCWRDSCDVDKLGRSAFGSSKNSELLLERLRGLASGAEVLSQTVAAPTGSLNPKKSAIEMAGLRARCSTVEEVVASVEGFSLVSQALLDSLAPSASASEMVENCGADC